jgi:hypothetical protein
MREYLANLKIVFVLLWAVVRLDLYNWMRGSVSDR